MSARIHVSVVPISAIKTKRRFDGIRGRYHVGLITTIAVFMLGAGLWMRSGPEAAVHDPVVEEAPIGKTTAMVAYLPALYINQAKLAEEPLAAY